MDELVALMEYYDNKTYHTAVIHLVTALNDHGLTGFEDTREPYDEDRHEVHQTYAHEHISSPTVGTCHLRGYLIDGVVVRKAVVDLLVPAEES